MPGNASLKSIETWIMWIYNSLKFIAKGEEGAISPNGRTLVRIGLLY